MSEVYSTIDASIAEFIASQHIYFVATAPTHGTHVNISPKGIQGTIVKLSDTCLAYLDSFGSGIETVAHVNENRRICIMMCSFDKYPAIWRFHGLATLHFVGSDEFRHLAPHFDVEQRNAYRCIVKVDVFRISKSCGLGVPRMEMVGVRTGLPKNIWASSRSFYDKMESWNRRSLDGLPGIALLARSESAHLVTNLVDWKPLWFLIVVLVSVHFTFRYCLP